MFELSGDDEINNRAEAEEHDEEALLEAIFDAAADYGWAIGRAEEKETSRKLGKTIDAALTHAFGEGYAQRMQDERREQQEQAMEKACRAMNETGQGEHMGIAA